MKEKKISRFKKISLVIGVLLIPTIYSLCYLQAYWNPYNSVDKLPVAVVNNDKGAVINSKRENLGNELVNELKKSNSLKCSFVSSKQATSGVETDLYYAVITVPADFSKDISTVSSTEKTTASIYYEPNEEHNYIASLLLRSAVNSIVTNLRGNVNKEITASLVEKLQNVPSQLHILGNGLSTLSSGAKQLSGGITNISNGQNTLLSGSASLDKGLSSLSSGANKLNTNLELLDTDLGKALSGAQQLSAGTGGLSAMSTGITSLNTAATQVSAGLGQLLAQFGTNSASPTLHDNITALNSGASAVASQFTDGSTSNLKYVISSLSNKTNGAPAYVNSVNSLVSLLRKDGGVYNSILSSLSSADASSKPAYANVLVLLTDTDNSTEVSYTIGALSAYGITSKDAIVAQQNELSSGGAAITQAVSVIASQFSASSSEQHATLYDGVTQLAAGTSQLTAQMTTSGNANKPTLYDDVNNLYSGATQLSAGTKQLSDSLPQLITLQTGVNSLTAALRQLKSGSSQLFAGSKNLLVGVASSKSGSSSLLSGSSQLNSGITTLQNGSSQLLLGINKAKATVNSAANAASSSLTSTKGLDSYTHNPVTLKETDINEVSNYGTAFAPFFVSLSLWIGAIMMFFGIHFDFIKRIKILTPDTEHTIIRTFLFLLIGIAQAFALGIIIQCSLDLKIANPFLYYLGCVLFALVSTSIVQFLIVHMRDLGKLISILLLIFSLTSCGGTFPVETVPGFYSFLTKFMPMTYSIDLFKQAIIGYHAADALIDIVVEIGLIVVFSSLTIVLLLFKKFRAKEASYEPIISIDDLVI